MKNTPPRILAKLALLAAAVVLLLSSSGCGIFMDWVLGPTEAEPGNLESINDEVVIVSEYGIRNGDTYHSYPDRKYDRDSLFVSKRSGRIWHTLKDNPCSLEAVSCNNTICESLSFPTYGGEKVSSVRILGEVSDELIALEIRSWHKPDFASGNGTILEVYCLYNRLSGEFGEELGKYRYVVSSQEAMETPSISVKNGVLYRYDPTSKTYAAYDLEDKCWRPAGDYKKIADAVDQNGNLSGRRLSSVWPIDFYRNGFKVKYRHDRPGSGPSTPVYCYNTGPLADYLRIWDWDPQSKKYVKESRAEYGFRFSWAVKDWDVSPDGKRILILARKPYIFDMSTGILAEVGDFAPSRWGIGGSWSPSGRYVTITRSTRRGDIITGGAGPPDLYGLEISTGRYKFLSAAVDDDFWMGVPRSKREVNIVYADWLLTLLERGAAEKKICARLQEFMSVEQTIAPQQWRAWFDENKNYLVWLEDEQRMRVDKGAKAAAIHAVIWNAISKQERAGWDGLDPEKRLALLQKAQAGLMAEAEMRASAWNAGVDLKVWRHIPSEVRDKWTEISDEKRLEEIAKAKKEYLKTKNAK